METIQGIYENGVVRPLEPLALPESTPVGIVVPSSDNNGEIGSNSAELYEILSHTYDTGDTDLAARVDELHP
jgi:predicted DNA-binding antitoxin AbrB/MazE fold protein